jgi:Tfp pilus assembly protein PilF
MSRDGYGTIAAVPAKLIDVSAPRRRLWLLIPAALIIASAYFVTRWCLGNTLAQHSADRAMAQLAQRLAPSDPQAHFTLAVLDEKSLLPEELTEAVREYERAASLSPHDYRVWQALGRARERAGDVGGGEQALKRAVELAPDYANPRWLLGNLLLRQGRTDDAFTELRRAADLMPTLRPQVFTLAWSVYDGELSSVIRALGDTPATRTQLIELLLNRKRMDEALALWTQLGAGEKREQAKTGEALRQTLFEQKRFRDAWRVSQEISPEGPSIASHGELANSGFEQDIRLSGQDYFGWQVTQGQQPAITIDTIRHHGGERSLLLNFNSSTGTELRNVSQLVLVEPNARYRLEYFARTEDLKSVSTLVVEVLAAVDGESRLAASAPLPPGTRDWQQFTLEFSTPQLAEAVTVRLAHVPCPGTVCPIYGKIWYDDFTLRRLG